MKYLKLVVFLLLIVLIDVKASTNVEIRSEDDLKIHESIVVDQNNIDNILKTPKVNEEEKVYDFADLFSNSEEIKIYNNISSFIELTNYDLAVVTINENNKSNEEEYADDFYDYNYFGFDDSFSGLLILIDMDNRGIYLSTTGDAIKMYDDFRIEYLIDAGWNDLESGQYSDCILKIIDKMGFYYDGGYPSGNIINYLLYAGIIGGIFSLIVSIIMYKKTSLKIKANNVVSYIVSEKNLNINKIFLRSAVSRVRRNVDTGGHSFGGGSSTHSGSSGRSHGGGGRRF